jgi:hypothetical protein
MYNTPELCPIRHIIHEKSNVTSTWKCCETHNKRVKRTKQKTIELCLQ